MAVLQAPDSTRCTACGGSRCDHEGILARLLGCEEAGLCLDCLAFAFGLEKGRFARGAVAHLRKKSCLWVAFERARGCGCSLEHATRVG
ncbi:MAG: hypothetical protein HYY18_14025 [Planctomycetes bacterium]|nr:hypothetical protein [Planctomycetota bacterium]